MEKVKERKITDFKDVVVFCVFYGSIIGFLFVLGTGKGFEILLADLTIKAIVILDLVIIVKFLVIAKMRKKSDVLFVFTFLSFSILAIAGINLVNHPEISSVINSPKALVLYFFITLILLWVSLIMKVIFDN